MAGAAQARRSRVAGPGAEARLTRAAQEGDLRAFATLYARHEADPFNLALRITGSRQAAAHITRDASVDALRALMRPAESVPGFATCLMMATRNAARERSEAASPAAWHEAAAGDPEDDAAHEALQQEVAQANFALPPDAREALALAEIDAMSYGEMGTVMGLDPDSVPAVVAGARIGLHDELFGTDLAGDSQPEDCDQSLALAAMRDDGQLEDREDSEWLLDHLAHCASCRLRLDAMADAAAGYRRWEPVAPPPALYGDTMAAAAQVTGAGADEIPPRPPESRAPAAGARASAAALAARAHDTTRGVGPTLGSAVTAAAGALRTLPGRGSALAAQRRRRPQRHALATAGLLVLVLGGLSAMAAGGALLLRDDEGPDATPPPAAEAAQPSTPAPAPVERKRKRRPNARPPAAATAPVAPRRLVVIPPQATPQTPQPRPRPERRMGAPKKKQTPPARTPRAEITPAPAPVPAPTPAPPAQGAPPPSNPPAVTPPQPGSPRCNGGAGNTPC